MPFFVQKIFKPLPQFCVVNKVFDEDEVNKIIDLEDLQKFQKGFVGTSSAGRIDSEYRDSEIMWIQHDESADWLFQKFGHLVSCVNTDHFMYEINHFDAFQYTVYDKNGHYDWHIDMSTESYNFERKISASILLSDPDEYEGGEFNIIPNGMVDNPIVIKPNKGDVIFFASWMPHKVSPVTSGVRKSLVCWVMGERKW